MHPQAKFALTLLVFLVVITGVLITLLITTTPRHVEYTLYGISDPSDRSQSIARNAEQRGTQKTTTLYDVLYEFGVIREPEDISDSDVEIEVYYALDPYTENALSTPMHSLEQINTNIVSTRDYMRFQCSGDTVRHLYYAEEGYTQEYTLAAYNYNLRSRQTAVFLFFMHNEAVSGYVLNNVWLYPINVTLITALLAPHGKLFLIVDLDGNVYSEG